MQLRSVVLVLTFFGVPLLAQVPAPKPEGLLYHIFAPHHDSFDLEQRSKSLSCAIVLVTAGNRTGTGFYVSAEGDIATAAHVLGDKIVAPLPNGKVWIAIMGPSELTIKRSEEEEAEPYRVSAVLENNADAFAADVALLKTGKPSPCWLQVDGEETIHTGQHVLALGFPGLAFGSLTMYTGIVTGRLKSNLPMGRTVQGMPYTSDVQFIRAQMPISPGFSGAPLIDDRNRAIGIVTNSGMWSSDLDSLIQRVSQQVPGARPSPAADGPDLQALIAELAESFHDYGSPGYGDAVPMRYLKKVPAANLPPAAPAH